MPAVTVYFPEDKELDQAQLERYLAATGWTQDSSEKYRCLWRQKGELINSLELQEAMQHLHNWERRATGLIYLDIVK